MSKFKWTYYIKNYIHNKIDFGKYIFTETITCFSIKILIIQYVNNSTPSQVYNSVTMRNTLSIFVTVLSVMGLWFFS